MYIFCTEPFALKKLLTELVGELKISVLTTDRSSLIKKLMKYVIHLP
jgi:hypothetical protein